MTKLYKCPNGCGFIQRDEHCPDCGAVPHRKIHHQQERNDYVPLSTMRELRVPNTHHTTLQLGSEERMGTYQEIYQYQIGGGSGDDRP